MTTLIMLFRLRCSELSFRKGDTVYLLHQIDRNWYEGERHGVRGIFPVNYVEVTSFANSAATHTVCVYKGSYKP